MNILSFGAGVNSTAILALVKLGKLDLGDFRIVFANTGGENPETYCHIREIQKEFDITIVKKEPNLYDYCMEKKIIPSRMLRWCTDKWKIQPINKWIKEQKIEEYKTVFGFAKGEEKRAKNYSESIYPLIELGVDRERCKKLIGEAGWSIPPKSGCFFCPFQRKRYWMALRENIPELFKKAVLLEKNCMRTDLFLYGNKPLSQFETTVTRLIPLYEYQHCLCSSG